MGYASTPSTISDVLLGHAARDPGAAAIVCPDIATLTFGDLARHIRRAARSRRHQPAIARRHRAASRTRRGATERCRLLLRDAAPPQPQACARRPPRPAGAVAPRCAGPA